ncbi:MULTISPECIES: FimV/HubP family polar landmark protein [unclassified Shewanella]|uniref:FimV/HubP family polar landmark protein n=1 Tax=unclassified Shewanella TaxID=196818 RepID=UPI001BC43C8B|nr:MULTISPECIES: FimV/HubP family polar landmark protein [unclassified Shewanella]GIU08514.1 pilus assembly protein FimV [Shewanella sp. MBTL60-112-B1]GIU38441.1 pilus assembly protein FimV [Shewanella sp. MBTL60-112-B2]
MNFRTSHLVGLLATGLVAFAAPSINPVVAEPLKITGPDGQVKQSIRQYGPTTSADTFWSIAQALKPDNSVTVYQVMAALYDANPHAFSSKNYNSLERGMILLVPTKAVMQQISKTDAKARAERNDRNWSTASAKPSVAATSVAAKPVTPEPVAVKVETPKATVAKSTVASKSNPLITELSAQVDALTKQVEDIQAQNLALTDELARASDEIVVGSSDTEAFQQEIAELKQENALLKQALQDTKSENQALNQEVQLKQQQLGAISAPKQEPTSDLWRTLMDNPLLLVLGAVLPALLVVALFWLFIRRRNDANSEQESEQAAEKELSGMKDDTSIDEKSDDADGLAVHLDTDDAAEQAPLKELAVVGAASLAEQEEQDIVVEDSNDEGQSLDDLWAEAMGEQDQNEANDFDAFEKQSKSVEEDDLDSLLAGFDDPVGQTDNDLTINEKPFVEQETTQDDDLDTLLAGFDEPAEQTEQNLSFNEQPFVAQDSEQQSIADDDLDALLAGFDEQSFVAQDTDLESTQDEDLDALLASFDEPAEQTAEAPADDIDALLADFDSANQQLEQADEPEVKAAEDDLDALLAELDDQTDNQANTAKHTVNNTESDVDALSDEMAAELELGFEIAAELDLSDDDAGQEKLDSELDSELDALLADFDTPIDAKESVLELEPEPQLESEPQDAIATELALTESAAIDETLDELKETPKVSAKDSNSLDFDLSDFEPSSVKANTDAEPSNNHDEELLEFTLPEPELEQELSSELDPQVIEKTDKESGFFDDLKGNKKAEENSLDWESIAAQSGNDAPAAPNAELATELAFSEADKVEVSDDELLSGLVSKGSAQDTTLDLEDETFSLDNDSKMTVDEALAALDAEELGGKEPSKSAVAMHDLTSFQKDNGFIDIDRLLSEADEDSGEIDLYKELDVDMGELDSLKGNTPMVDVDDEENSVNAKLDLARAYIEIDDSDSARALLKEVELDGNDRQQAEALGLLKELV